MRKVRTALAFVFFCCGMHGMAAALAQPYSGYSSVASTSVLAACGTFYAVDTIVPGATTVALPPAASCSAGGIVTIKKVLLPAHGGPVTAQPATGETIETLAANKPLVTEKNGQIMRLVSNGTNGWTLDGDFSSFSSTSIVNHHSIGGGFGPGNPWAINPATMGGEMLAADPTSAGGHVMLNIASLTGATVGYSPQTYWFGNLASGSTIGGSPQPEACLSTSGITIEQGSNAYCLDHYGDYGLAYVDGSGGINIIATKRGAPTEVQQMRCSGQSSANITVEPYGRGAGIALPRTTSGVQSWHIRDLPAGRAVTVNNPGYGTHGAPGGTYEVYVWEIPQGMAVNDRAGTVRVVLGPSGQVSQRDGALVNSAALPTDFTNQVIQAYAARHVCRITLDGNGNIASIVNDF